MKLRTVFLTTALLYSSQCLAFFCPNNFNQINIGDNIDQVALQCGKPSSEIKSKKEPSVPQEWTYYMTLPQQNEYTAPGATPGTMKVTFAFVDDKVVNLTSNGIGVGATTICNNTNIQLGTAMKDVEKACGKAANITKSQAQSTTPPVEVIEWKFDGPPAVTLTFENGTLKSRS
ncbi:MAG: hypothetical protein ACYCQI_12020 [Gammaproteobacteria bacterium]